MSIKARYCGSDTTALSDFTSISRIKRAVDSQTGMINLCRRVSFYLYLYLLFIRAAGLQVQRESTAILSLQEALRRHSHYLYLFML